MGWGGEEEKEEEEGFELVLMVGGSAYLVEVFPLVLTVSALIALAADALRTTRSCLS